MAAGFTVRCHARRTGRRRTALCLTPSDRWVETVEEPSKSRRCRRPVRTPPVHAEEVHGTVPERRKVWRAVRAVLVGDSDPYPDRRCGPRIVSPPRVDHLGDSSSGRMPGPDVDGVRKSGGRSERSPRPSRRGLGTEVQPRSWLCIGVRRQRTPGLTAVRWRPKTMREPMEPTGSTTDSRVCTGTRSVPVVVRGLSGDPEPNS